jgi:hypothetical protein
MHILGSFRSPHSPAELMEAAWDTDRALPKAPMLTGAPLSSLDTVLPVNPVHYLRPLVAA